jgi:hypothetical protein
MLAKKLMMAGGAGKAVFGFVASSQSFDNTNPNQATIPPEASDGDLLYMFVSARNNISTPAGWTSIVNNNRGSMAYALFTKDAISTDPGSTFTYDTRNDEYNVTIAAFKNATPSVYGAADDNRTQQITVGEITTLNANDIVIVWAAMEGNGAAGEHPILLSTSGFTDITGGVQPTNWVHSSGIHYKVQASAGATGDITYLGSGGNFISGFQIFSITSTL